MGIPDHTHQKQYRLLVGNSDAYLHAKNQFDMSFFFFLEILHFKESFNLIRQKYFGPYFEN